MANSISKYDWLVADSEGEEDTLITNASAGQVNPEVSAIQTATFTPVDSPPLPHQTTTEISSASLFTPPPAEKSAISTISPFTAESPVRPRPRPRPRPRTSIVNQSWLDGDKTGGNDTSIDRASTIASTSLVTSSDKARDPISTSTAISTIIDDLYSSYGIAERAKMRVRNSRKSIQEGPSEVQSAKASYKINSSEIIELTSDEDERSLIPAKPSKRQKSQSKPKAKKSTKMAPPSDILFSDPLLPDDPLPPSSIQAPSESIPSTIPTIPATTPPEVSPLRNPVPSPSLSPRKRKRRQLVIDSDADADDIDMDSGVADAPIPSALGPPLFFASSSLPIPEADAEVPDVAAAETSFQKKGKKQTESKKKDTKKQAVNKSKKKGKQQIEVVIDTVDKSKPQNNAFVDPSLSTATTSVPPAPLLDESDLSPVPDSESEDVLQHQKAEGKEVLKADVERSTDTSRNKKRATATPSMKRKGKGKSKAILSDDDEAGYADKSEVPSVGADADVSIGLASKENIHPHLGEIPQQSKPSTKVSPPPGLEIAARGRSTSIKPSIKPTPMSELIKRVNSQPGSPFAHSPRPAPIYSPYLKSSRSLLSRIAPLHPNRRTPPPPLPRPPPPKKSKKQLQMEERIEEELAETIEGWSCMTNEERKELKRARIDLELGGYD